MSVTHSRRGGRDISCAKVISLDAGTREAAEWENRLFDRLIDLLDGFKEVRLNRRAAKTCSKTSSRCRRTAANIKIRTQSETFKRLVLSQTSMYMLLGVGRVHGSDLQQHDRGSITKTMTAL